MRMAMEDYWKSAHLEGGYELLNTPHMASVDLWKTSGHFDFYKEGMFDQMEVEDADYQLKPMNCPFHVPHPIPNPDPNPDLDPDPNPNPSRASVPRPRTHRARATA